MVILCVSLISPTFAYADNGKSERKGENNSRKSAQVTQKIEKKEIKKEKKEEKREEKKEHREEKKEVKKVRAKKMNYFFCVTATDWKVVPVEAYKENNSNNYLGEDCVKLPSNIAKRLQKIMGGTTATTTPDVLAPVITLATATGLTPTGATISWTTNELANGNIYVSATSPVNMSTATTLGTTTLSTLHSFNLSGLTANTTYYYVVKSADASNNVSTSTQMSFVTPAVADTIAPVISTVVPFTVASTTANVSWTTNESATGKLWYGTSTPSTLFATTTSGTTHAFSLTGLTASTTYQLLFEAKDLANNAATSSASLVTTN